MTDNEKQAAARLKESKDKMLDALTKAGERAGERYVMHAADFAQLDRLERWIEGLGMNREVVMADVSLRQVADEMDPEAGGDIESNLRQANGSDVDNAVWVKGFVNGVLGKFEDLKTRVGLALDIIGPASAGPLAKEGNLSGAFLQWRPDPNTNPKPMAIMIKFNKARAQYLLRCLATVARIRPEQQGWSGNDTLVLAGDCFFGALSQGSASFWTRDVLGDLRPECREVEEASFFNDPCAAVEFCGNLTVLVQDGGYRGGGDSSAQAPVTGKAEVNKSVQPISDMKAPVTKGAI